MKKNRIQRWIHTLMAWVMVSMLTVSCQQDEWPGMSNPVPEGYLQLNFSADIPAMQEVETRAVDPDGGGVQDMTLFCFDRYGLFITYVPAELNSNTQGVHEGTFTAMVPKNTRIVHFVANQVMTDFNHEEFREKSEVQVMALLEGSSGRMIYWSRFACNSETDEDRKVGIVEQMQQAGNQIMMLRNHAKVSVSSEDVASPTHFKVNGFAVYNTQAFGTVAPFHPDKGFAFTKQDWIDGDFVTLPARRDKLSDVTQVTTQLGRYIFECENRFDDPVSVILYGHNVNDPDQTDRYYRVMLMQEGEHIPLRRNYDYQIHIAGELSYGQGTFEEAVQAPATNNVWVSISDRVNEVQDNNYKLRVDQTDYVLDELELAGARTYTLRYWIEGMDGNTITDADQAEVTWMENFVARQEFAHTFRVNQGVGEGTIGISLLSLGENEKLEGTLLVKKGQLQRKIKVILLKRQKFVPSWVGSEIYGNVNERRSHVTVMFTVPESCPPELFPLKTYLSVDGLDIRAAAGMAHHVVRKGDKEWYSSGQINPEPDYKYLFVVEQPGVQRVYFENVLQQSDGTTGTVHIEAEHFDMMSRTFTYSSLTQAITVEGLLPFSRQGGGIEGQANDEMILYRLVPQKLHANVNFFLQLRDKKLEGTEGDMKGDPFNAGAKDEFMLYARYLDHYEDGQEGQAGVTAFDCTFYPQQSEQWWQSTNPNGGRMLMFKPKNPTTPSETGRYAIYMKTNRPKSAEVIRIATCRENIAPVLPEDANNEGIYAGKAYRSVTFELANYNPFRFGARLTYQNQEHGEEPSRPGIQDVPELITPSTWSYEPGQEVRLDFDVTSFRGSDGASVDPFGEAFKIYIDAPMLELDPAKNPSLGENKLYADKTKKGRFVYVVDAKRAEERGYFPNSTVVNKDVPLPSGGETVDQTGERKSLYFKVKDIVSAGDIVLSSDESQVVYYSKTFRISNASIRGRIFYQPAGGAPTTIPSTSFVAFEREHDGSRIGSVTVHADGSYELRLRKEYTFQWDTEPIQFDFSKEGVEYTARYESLKALFANPDNVVLAPKGAASL